MIEGGGGSGRSALTPARRGRRVRRLEDKALVTGRGSYAGDYRRSDLAHLAVVRASIAHGEIRVLDLEAARGLPGVLMAAQALDLPETARILTNSFPAPTGDYGRPVLASGRVRYVGEAVAFVVADERYQARDAADAVVLEVRELQVVVDRKRALQSEAGLVHSALETNIARQATYSFGATAEAFANADVVVSQRLKAERVCGMAIEPRVTTAYVDATSGVLTLQTSTQSVFMVREEVSKLLGIDPMLVRVLATDVGGGFGPKGVVYPEEIMVAYAAIQLGRPVQWTASRTEDSATTVHAHGTTLDLELAATRDGRLLGLRGSIVHDMGAYASPGYDQPDNIASHLLSAYALPAMDVSANVVFTNATPTGFIRGGARELGIFAIERLMDRLARKMSIDPVEIRRRNLIALSNTPHDTKFPKGSSTIKYDPSDYCQMLEAVVQSLDPNRWRSLPSDGRKAIGIGIACCVESSGYGNNEPAQIHLNGDGVATVTIGSTSQGQGHATMAAALFSERLGWPLEKIKVVLGDTQASGRASLTAGSRTAIHVGNSVAIAAEAARRALLQLASDRHEVSADDLFIHDGIVGVKGNPSRSWSLPSLLQEAPLVINSRFETNTPAAYPSSCHGVVVAIDRDLGSVEVLRYVIAHDNGTVINPLTFEGQVIGGWVHGLGYALLEEAVVTEDGNLATSSFVDYLIPSAAEFKLEPELLDFATASPFNPEGIKGAGESGTVPVAAAVANAVEDALISAGLADAVVDRLPITPETVLSWFARENLA